MTRRIFRAICLVSIVVLLASLALTMGVLYDYFSGTQRQQLKTQTMLASQGAANEGWAYFDGLDTEGYRITWISPDGKVIYDNQTDAAGMENHLDREEVREALDTGYGESSRYSSTLTERLLYSAARLPDGSVIRLSGTQYTMLTLVLAILQPVLVIFAFALAASLLFASRLSKKIVGPLNSLDLDHPLKNTRYPELSPLLDRLDSQQRQLRRHAAELRRRQEELETVTDNMSEGIVLLNEKGRVLSINHRALTLLCTEGCVGESIYTSVSSKEVLELIDAARGGVSTEKIIDLGDGRYQFNTNPVITDAAVTGVALIIFDITEKERSEQMRREFTANVSHELKTPLHSISGCAELMKNGIVRQEDIPRFSGQIYSEAQRMIRLVDDIIRLSRLDEGSGAMRFERLDLYESAAAAVKNLEDAAGRAGVEISLQGGPAFVMGVPQLLSGIIFNLCDNAIKYNRNGGKVFVSVLEKEGRAELSVRDTGIGISPEHQDRIFERFYRVDKSHSQEVGGTGLGLSIVKHAARLHKAEIKLESSPGEGSCFTVLFPAAD